jgi:hypothetical protein
MEGGSVREKRNLFFSPFIQDYGVIEKFIDSWTDPISFVFSKPLMEGYMGCRDGTPFLKERWGFVFIES